MTSPRLAGKVALVSGAASGIGRAAARLFAAEGAMVLATDILDDRGATLAAEHPNAIAYRHCDVTQPDHIAAAVDAAVKTFGGLDVVVNNAGAPGTVAMVEDMDVEGWDHTHALLLRSVVLGTKHAVAPMRARGGGAIINMASAAGIIVGGTPAAYTTMKGAVIHFSKAAAIELAPSKIRVNAICPGVIATPIWGKVRADADLAQADQVAAMMAHAGAGLQPLPRAGEVEDIAEACAYLAADSGRFVTGQSLVVDGGITIGARARTKTTMGGFVSMAPDEAAKMYEDALAHERAQRAKT